MSGIGTTTRRAPFAVKGATTSASVARSRRRLGLDPIPLPMLDAGPYLSYGLQWLAFGIMAPLAIGYFVWSEVRRRREDKAVFDAGTADSADAPEDEATPEVTPEAARAARLADRYGRKGQ